MADHVYKVVEIVGSAATVDAAINNAVTRTAQTVRGLDWFKVTEIRGHISDGAVEHVQVSMQLGFKLED